MTTDSLIISGLQVLVTIGSLYFMVRKMTGAKEERLITNNPLEVREATKYMTQDACGKLHNDFDRRLTFLERRIIESDNRLDDHVQRIETKGEERASKLHARIDGLADRLNTAVGEIKGEIRRIK